MRDREQSICVFVVSLCCVKPFVDVDISWCFDSRHPVHLLTDYFCVLATNAADHKRQDQLLLENADSLSVSEGQQM